MPRLKLELEYDGGAFVGWQVQPNGVSVQSVVERALQTLLGAPTPVECAGRTDSGVHAERQVIAFDTERTLPMKAYVQGLGSLLPDEVCVVSAAEVSEDFDPRRWARGKRYRYRILNRAVRSPLHRRTHWEVFVPLDAAAMREAAQHLLGRHDFSAFRAADCQARHPVRTITALSIEPRGREELEITVEGTAFLKHMVRNLVGTLVEVGRGKRSPSWVAQVLASRDRSLAGRTAPAQGLTLVEVFYDDAPPHAPPNRGPSTVAGPDDGR